MVNKEAFHRFEALQHSKQDGFYDKDLDLFFSDLSEWLKYNGYTWKDVSPQ